MRLKDIGYLYSGLAGKSGDDFNVDDSAQGRPFVPFTNIFNNFRVDVTAVRFVRMANAEAQNRVAKGDLLFLMSSEDYESIGKPAVVSDDVDELYLNSFCRGLRITRSDVSSDYIAYFLSAESVREILRLEARGFTRINLKVDRLASQEIRLPTLAAQRRIVAYLDEKTAAIDARVAVLERKLAAYKRLKTSVINRAVTRGVPGWGSGLGLGERDNRDHRDERDSSRESLAAHSRAASGAKVQGRRVPEVAKVAVVPCRGRPVDRPLRDSGVDWIGKVPEEWEVKRIKDIGTGTGCVFTDGDWINFEDLSDEGIRYFTTGNVGQGYFKQQGDGYISADTFKRLGCFAVRSGDIIISRLNEPVGRACIIPDGYETCIVAVDCVVLRPSEEWDKRYFVYCCSTDAYLATASFSARGTTMPRISRTQLGVMKVPCPSLSEQRAIADYLDAECAKIERAAALVTREIALYRNLKRSLINEVVTGKREPDAGRGLGWGLGSGERDNRDHRDERDGSHATLAAHGRAASGVKVTGRCVPEVAVVPEVLSVSVVSSTANQKGVGHE